MVSGASISHWSHLIALYLTLNNFRRRICYGRNGFEYVRSPEASPIETIVGPKRYAEVFAIRSHRKVIVFLYIQINIETYNWIIVSIVYCIVITFSQYGSNLRSLLLKFENSTVSLDESSSHLRLFIYISSVPCYYMNFTSTSRKLTGKHLPRRST